MLKKEPAGFYGCMDNLITEQARCSKPGGGAPVCNRRSVAPGH